MMDILVTALEVVGVIAIASVLLIGAAAVWIRTH